MSKLKRTSCYILVIFLLFQPQQGILSKAAPEPQKEAVPKTENKNEDMDLEDEESPEEAIQRIYDDRNKAFLSGNTDAIKDDYDTSQKFGLWAYEHEIKRVKYLRQWAKERNMNFLGINSFVRIKKCTKRGIKSSLSLEESYKFDYVYENYDQPYENSFGVGIRHGVSLINKNGKWQIFNDWYTDCFEDALSRFSIGTASASDEGLLTYIEKSMENVESIVSKYIYKRRYDREKAVQYADKYCGAAWGSGNNYKYNKKYADFNGAGGDCTNFVSQVLGDKEEGGGMPFDGSWRCIYHKYGGSSGSRAWVNADGLKDYLIYSGRGRVIKRGTFKELTKPDDMSELGAVGRLEIGDLVCYEKKGNIDHFAVITAKDSAGYPLVNSHTTDRYHVPWDLGWGDNGIRFYLIHIN